MTEIDDTVAALQQDIRSRREALDRIGKDDPGYEAALEGVMDSTAALVAFERRIPAIVAEPHRRRTEQIITWVIRAFVGVILALGVLVAVPGGINGWWLALLAPLAGFGVWLLWLHPVGVGARHVAQRMGAFVLVVVAVVTFIILVMGLPAVGTVIGVVAIVACLAMSRRLLYIDEDAGGE